MLIVLFNNKNLRMNQEIVFASDRNCGQTNISEIDEFSIASTGKQLKLINRWNEKVGLRDIAYH